MSEDTRKIALFILNTLDKGRKTLDRVMQDVTAETPLLPRRDLALLYALVYGVLRWRGRLDWTVGHFSNTDMKKIDPKVLNILRLGLFQIIYLDRIPVSAAVNTSVEMAKPFAPLHVVRFVNAILRRAAGEYKNIPFPDLNKDPLSALAVEKSFPKWLIKRWLERFGLNETGALCDSANTIPPITVRTNTLKTTRDKLVQSLEREVGKIFRTIYAPDGVCLFNLKKSIPDMKSFEDGWFQVQDEAAQLVTHLLNPQPGENVLDACAGLGGKTGHIAQMMKNHGNVVAMDKDDEKLLQLKTEMKRLGVSIVTTDHYDLNKSLSKKHFSEFDRVLLDAPCSGLGVLRRNPDIKWTKSKKRLKIHQEKQVTFLNNLATFVKPSGVLVFSVCSLEPEENEMVINDFLNKRSNFVIENSTMGLPLKARSLVNSNRHLRTLPHLHNMDGFFSVSLKRTK